MKRGIEMKKAVILSVAALSLLVLSGCGNPDKEQATSTPQAQPQVAASTPKSVDQKAEYVQTLNNMKIKAKLQFMGDYGDTAQQLNKMNKDELKKVREVHEMVIPQYQTVLIKLKTMPVPEEYQGFHSLLISTVSSAISTVQEMKIHLDNMQEKEHLVKSVNHYITTAKSYEKLSKELPFGELQ